MFSPKIIVALMVLVSISNAKVLYVRNTHSTALVVTADGSEYTIAAGGLAVLTAADDSSSTISAIPDGAEVTDGPKTKVDISLSTTGGDSYSISLVDGFNLGAKIVPNGSTSCSSVVCAANILRVCPVLNQVTNSNGTTVACQNTPLIMSKLCPLVVVDDTTAANVQTCSDATSYLLMFL